MFGGGFFYQMFGENGQAQFQGGHHQQQPNNTPPTSKRTLRSLPTVMATGDDLIEESNKNCCICLEDQQIGTTVVKLPCGHIFHPACLKEWLEKSCMVKILLTSLHFTSLYFTLLHFTSSIRYKSHILFLFFMM